MAAETSQPDTVLPDDIRALSFEAALAELEGIVRRLEDGSGELDQAISAYERGALLKRHCEAKLAEAQGRVDRISLTPDGAVEVGPAHLDD
ncbi:MAG: exodeoxyribonuclease VII small subunit [Magnetovibrionaceae bacterium]